MNSRADAAARGGDLLIALPRRAHLEFIGAIAREDRMRVRVNKTGHYNTPGSVNDFTIRANQLFDLVLRAGLNDASAANKHRAIADDRQITHLLPDARATRPGQGDKLGSPDDGK